MSQMQTDSMTLTQLNQRIAQLLYSPLVQNVWITAETADLRVTGGHCYLDLVEKDDNGRQLARNRATIWASVYYQLAAKFTHQTGQTLRSDLKVMVKASANYHPLYGLSLNISDINGAYTLGDVIQRRNQMIMQLQREGIIGMNRELNFPLVPQRIAIISAKGAAGYGDFINQLYTNNARLRFSTRLFPAAMQGERTAPTIIAALEQIAAESEMWDCVVIIRGGGASTDLLAFDNYDLAANIAQFPLPVIIGIGHERDITLLDYVAKMRVKTPTAAAEWLIQCGEAALGYLQDRASAILHAVSARLSGCHQQLAYIAGALPGASTNALTAAKNKLTNARLALATISDRRIRPELLGLSNRQQALHQAISVILSKERQKLEANQKLIEVLSPEATLKRGYSITRIAGHSITGCKDISSGEVIETLLADGTILSKVISQDTRDTI